ncbi:MAG: hypothetical protein EOP62_23105 [Sphingomonadales bacterium]|nr:MAG: hypothetical protein EOP62_23105 [Sphingomonadales bacterium]
MIWGIIYLALLVAITITVSRIGERESVIAVLTVFIGTAMTFASLLVSGSRYDIFSMLVTSVDFLVLAFFLGHALTSRRYWVLCLPALQLITCFAHLVKYVAPEFLPRAYSAGAGFMDLSDAPAHPHRRPVGARRPEGTGRREARGRGRRAGALTTGNNHGSL